MNVRMICVATMVALAGSACASMRMMNAPLREGTIELWRDANNTCHTQTTPYFKVKKRQQSKVKWTIIDKTGCATATDVEIKFDKGDDDPLPACTKKGRRKIECPLPDNALEGPRKYSVFLGSEKEDPVLEIEQI
jgi:hypothetical protein